MATESSDLDIRFYGPILDCLRELGGSGTPREVLSIVMQRVPLTDEELALTNKNGGSKVENEIHWARNDLKDLGLLDGSTRGVWRLTEDGAKKRLDVDSARAIRLELRDIRKQHGILRRATNRSEEVATSFEHDEGESSSLLTVLMSLSPAGFERLSQLILREAGFSEVHVTGKSGDGGIDGHGILQVNELVSFRVLFQCKRYRDAVGPSYIRDFRGAMTGRADKGIILTTSSFTREAENEATRDGAPPIELVDGSRLVKLMERLGIGVTPRTVFDVDDDFFAPYR